MVVPRPTKNPLDKWWWENPWENPPYFWWDIQYWRLAFLVGFAWWIFVGMNMVENSKPKFFAGYVCL